MQGNICLPCFFCFFHMERSKNLINSIHTRNSHGFQMYEKGLFLKMGFLLHQLKIAKYCFSFHRDHSHNTKRFM